MGERDGEPKPPSQGDMGERTLCGKSVAKVSIVEVEMVREMAEQASRTKKRHLVTVMSSDRFTSLRKSLRKLLMRRHAVVPSIVPSHQLKRTVRRLDMAMRTVITSDVGPSIARASMEEEEEEQEPSQLCVEVAELAEEVDRGVEGVDAGEGDWRAVKMRSSSSSKASKTDACSVAAVGRETSRQRRFLILSGIMLGSLVE